MILILEMDTQFLEYPRLKIVKFEQFSRYVSDRAILSLSFFEK